MYYFDWMLMKNPDIFTSLNLTDVCCKFARLKKCFSARLKVLKYKMLVCLKLAKISCYLWLDKTWRIIALTFVYLQWLPCEGHLRVVSPAPSLRHQWTSGGDIKWFGGSDFKWPCGGDPWPIAVLYPHFPVRPQSWLQFPGLPRGQGGCNAHQGGGGGRPGGVSVGRLW